MDHILRVREWTKAKPIQERYWAAWKSSARQHNVRLDPTQLSATQLARAFVSDHEVITTAIRHLVYANLACPRPAVRDQLHLVVTSQPPSQYAGLRLDVGTLIKSGDHTAAGRGRELRARRSQWFLHCRGR